MNEKKEYDIKLFSTSADWEEWLEKNGKITPGIWVKFARKGSGEISVSFDEALECALCYGWIDGQGKSLDETFYLNKFTPRGVRSTWSKRNCDIVERLIKEKRMRPSGLAAVEAAKKDGRWDRAYDSPKNMVVPDDFLQKVKKNAKTYAFYQTLNKTNTYAIAWRLQTAIKPETRERRMKTILEMLEKGEKIH